MSNVNTLIECNRICIEQVFSEQLFEFFDNRRWYFYKIIKSQFNIFISNYSKTVGTSFEFILPVLLTRTRFLWMKLLLKLGIPIDRDFRLSIKFLSKQKFTFSFDKNQNKTNC